MTLKNTIKFTFLFGLLSVSLVLYFYISHRNFMKNHKEFMITATALQWEQSRLSNNVLHSSLKAYFNQDLIVKNEQNIKKLLKDLQNTSILKYENYKTVKFNLTIIKEQLDVELLNIDRFAMLNAGIKNSLLFLNRHLKSKTLKKNSHLTIYVQALHILKLLQDTKNTLDMDNLKGGDELLLHSASTNKQLNSFIRSFNAHSLHLQKNLPLFIHLTKQITRNSISTKVSDLNILFSSIALNDFKAFDRYAIIVILLLLISFTLIILFFSKYEQEHKALTKAKLSLEYSLLHDELTAIHNRKSFEVEIQKHLHPTILLIDIVGFKNINDVYGIDAGNKLLQQFAYFLSKHMQTNPEVHLFRLGSDEFCIICAKKTKKEILTFAHRIDALISAHAFKILTTQINIQVKIAINNIKPYLENADLTLKILKKDYSKSILFHKENFELKKNISDALTMLNKIKSAIAQDRVMPYFQPIINLKTMKIQKYEALIRIKCLDGSILQPYEFLELSKKSSYYNKLTQMMIQKTIAVAKEYPAYRFSINISMLDIANDIFLHDIFNEFDKDLETTSRIDIELLESEEMHEKDKITHFINRAKTYGVKILIDDFGTGYSNFSYFSDFDVNYLKIDGSITKEITSDSKKLHIFKSICDFSKGMNIDNIAEFVESKEILDMLQKLEVKYAQGYYISKPLPKPLESDEIKFGDTLG